MTLNASGPISLGGATAGQSTNLELGQAATAQISMNDANVRTLTATSAGTALIMPTNFYNKSANASYSLTSGTGTYYFGYGTIYWSGYSIATATLGVNFGSINLSTFGLATIKGIYSVSYTSAGTATSYSVVFSGSRGTGFFNTLTIGGTLVSGTLSSYYNGPSDETIFSIALASSAATLLTGTKTILLT